MASATVAKQYPHLYLELVSKITYYKKVLPRERKRHTTRRVASARFADQSPDRRWVPHPIQSWMRGDTQSSLGWGVLHSILNGEGTPSSPRWGGGVHPSCIDGAVPHQVLMGGYPQVPPGPDLGWGYPPISRMGYPHLDLGLGTLHLDLGCCILRLDLG